MLKRKILIIDDEQNFTNMLKLNLEETGSFDVLVENEALQSIDAAKNFNPDLILLDIVMPGMEGPDVVYNLKKTEEIKNTPVVFLTATITKEEVEAQNGLIAGHTFLAKPVSLGELIDCIEKKIGNIY